MKVRASQCRDVKAVAFVLFIGIKKRMRQLAYGEFV